VAQGSSGAAQESLDSWGAIRGSTEALSCGIVYMHPAANEGDCVSQLKPVSFLSLQKTLAV
jgi:hypothetical protein